MFILLLKSLPNLPTFENQFLIRENYKTDRLISDDQTLWKHISISAHLTSCPYSFKASSPSHWSLPRRGETMLESILCAAFYIGCEKPIPSLLPNPISLRTFSFGELFCANLLLSIVAQLSAQKTESSKIS